MQKLFVVNIHVQKKKEIKNSGHELFGNLPNMFSNIAAHSSYQIRIDSTVSIFLVKDVLEKIYKYISFAKI